MADVPPGYEDVPPGFVDDSVPDGFEPTPEEAPEPSSSAPAQAENGSSIYESGMTFRDLNLSPDILDALLLDMKFERPSKIQALTLPRVLSEPDRHMIAQGHNGCGKTTCFTLAMLMRCARLLV
jgi:ATP-dependent RNA helicase DDX19/DBP5